MAKKQNKKQHYLFKFKFKMKESWENLTTEKITKKELIYQNVTNFRYSELMYFQPPAGPHVFSVFLSLGFGLPRVTKAEVRQRVQNPPPGSAADPGDGRRERAQGSDGRAHAGDGGLAAKYLHAAGTQLTGQQHWRHSPQEEEGQSAHTHTVFRQLKAMYLKSRQTTMKIFRCGGEWSETHLGCYIFLHNYM